MDSPAIHPLQWHPSYQQMKYSPLTSTSSTPWSIRNSNNLWASSWTIQTTSPSVQQQELVAISLCRATPSTRTIVCCRLTRFRQWQAVWQMHPPSWLPIKPVKTNFYASTSGSLLLLSCTLELSSSSTICFPMWADCLDWSPWSSNYLWPTTILAASSWAWPQTYSCTRRTRSS